MSSGNLSHLLHPELITQIPLTGNLAGARLNDLVGEVATQEEIGLPPVSVVIRTLNEAEQLHSLLEDVEAQRRSNDVQVVVVDNESSDKTQKVARCFGSDVVQINRADFTYPRALNAGMEAADNPVVYLTVGHARLSNRQTFVAAAHHLRDDAVGAVFGQTLPAGNASAVERTIAIVDAFSLRRAHTVKKAGLGVMGATSLAISKAAWQELGRFDERYETGVEDTAMGAKMLSSGLAIIQDPVLAVHHTHGLGLINTVKQWSHWIRTVREPVGLDIEKLKVRRPDLNFD